MANILKVKRSSVQGKIPLTTDIDLGELAVNTYDGKLFLKKNVGGTETIVDVTVGADAGTVLNLLKTVDGSGSGLDADLVEGMHAVSTNTVNSIVARDASGNFSAGTITAALSGNASTTTKLATARTISITGDVTGSVSFDGSADASITATIAANSVALGTDTTGNYVADVTAGSYITKSGTAGEGWFPTIAVDATSANTASKVVARDASGNFSAGTITATLSGNASTVTNGIYTTGSYADPAWITSINYSKLTGTIPTWNQNTTGSAAKWTTARTLSFTGDATGSGSVDGSANVATALTLANSGVTAGTYTKITVDAKGRATSGTTLAATDIPALDASKITSGVFDAARLPSYVDDVLEYTNLASFPATGETGKIYVDLATNKTYRWSGTVYVYITSGAVDSVAGKTGVVTLTNSDVGLGNVENKSSATIRGELTSANVTTALGYTPYNSTNPSGYTTNTGTVTSITGGSYLTGGTITTSGTLAVDATSANTASKVVARDASGNFSAQIITSYKRQENYGISTDAGTTAGIMGGTSGGTIAAPTQTTNATTLYKISPLGYTGSAWTGGAGLSFVATENITSTNRGTNVVLTAIATGGSEGTNLVWNGSTLVANGTTLTGNTGTVTSVTGGSYLTGGTITTSGTLAVDATSANTVSKVVARDASGNFSAGTITASLNGNASTASTWQTSRTLTIGSTGKVVNGSADVSWSLAEIGAAAASHTHAYLTAESDTLATVTGRGAVASGSIAVPAGENNGYGFWGSNDTYGISMGSTAGTYQYGPVTDYSIKMHMSSNAGRGFTWGVKGSKPVAALEVTTGNMQIAGSFYAASKSFLISHPTKEGKKLCYGSLEGPENGVYIRGKLKGNVIELPDYWTKLVDPDSITVQLTPIGKHQKLYVEDIKDNKVFVANDGLFTSEVNCFYFVQAERVDVAKIQVEIG